MSTINECAKTDSKEIKDSLRISMLEGGAAGGMLGFTQDYLTPCLLFLGGTVAQVGMLTALPSLFSSLFQFKSPDYTNRLKSRNRIINICVFLQILMMVLVVLALALKLASPAVFIIAVVLFTSFGSFASPAWASLMSDLVADNKRGKFFGFRNKVVGLTIVAMSFVAGLVLHIFKQINLLYGFLIIFTIAAVFRTISWRLLAKMHEPCLNETKDDHFTFYEFIVQLRQSNFAKFVVFVSFFNFAVNLATPFFSVYMLKNLGFSYITYTIVMISVTITMYLSIERWGRHADFVGNIKVIRITTLIISFLPALWLINRHPVFLIAIQILAGFVWAGFNLSAVNFIYDAVSPVKRTRCIAYFNFLNGIFICAGALIGGFVLKWLPAIAGSGILTLFLISSLARLWVSLYLPKNVKEVRKVEKVKSIDLFLGMLGIKPLPNI